MTHKQRVLAAIKGEPADRLEFCSRIELWYNYHAAQGTLPERYRSMTQWELQRKLDIGLVGYYGGGANFYSFEYHDMELTETRDELSRRVAVETPHGSLSAAWMYPAELKGSASSTIQTEHLFKGPEDYDALLHYISNSEPVENFAQYRALPDAIGEDGVALPFTQKVPIHLLMEDYMGYERFYYEFHDNRERVELLHDALCRQQLQIMELAAAAPCEIVEVGGNYDEQMTPPPIFETHIAPFHRQAAEILHRGGKLVATHGDGEMKRLLELLIETDVDVVESITPEPMTTISMRHLRELWADGPAIWGGLSAIIFTPTFANDAFRRYVDDLLETMAGHPRFILGFGDNVPTDAIFERVEYVAELVSQL